MFLFCFDVSPAGIFLPLSNATTNEAPKAAVNGLSEDGNRRSSLEYHAPGAEKTRRADCNQREG